MVLSYILVACPCRYFYFVEESLLWYFCQLLTESVVALGMKFSTVESLHFVLPSAERVSSMNWVRDTQIIWTEVLSAFCFYHIDFCLVSLIYSFDVIFLPVIWQRANRWLLVTVVVVVIVILEAPDFLSQILGVRSIGKSGFRFWESKSGLNSKNNFQFCNLRLYPGIETVSCPADYNGWQGWP